MKLIVATEYHFKRGPDGLVYSENGTRDYRFWSRYLSVFDSVTIVGRLTSVFETGRFMVEGPSVTLIPLPGFVGPWQFLNNFDLIRKTINDIAKQKAAFLARCPGTVGTMLIKALGTRRQVYGVEVVGDPLSVFAPKAIDHPLRPILRSYFVRQLKSQCRHAAVATYVTETYLQSLYPCSGKSFSISDVDLPKEAFVQAPRVFTNKNDRFNLIFVGSLSQPYKACDILLKAVKICLDGGLDLSLTLVGEGKLRPKLENLAAQLGISKKIVFLGQLPAGVAVRAQLDQADLFVLPSRTEGKPRAMIEAMARGLPCVGSRVGGIPELLAGSCLVAPGDVRALAEKIISFLSTPETMNRMSAANLEKVLQFEEQLLHKRRKEFFSYLKEKAGE